MTERTFQPGDRVEFNSLVFAQRLFRGTVEEKLAAGLYWVVHDGEKKGRLVKGERLRRRVTALPTRGGDAA